MTLKINDNQYCRISYLQLGFL